jgi:hypothetical protein
MVPPEHQLLLVQTVAPLPQRLGCAAAAAAAAAARNDTNRNLFTHVLQLLRDIR